MFNTIKNWFYQRSLASVPVRAQRKMNLDKAKSVGILFDANNLENRKIVLKYAAKLKKAGKKVSLLGYLDIADDKAQFDFNFYSRKNIDWANRPKGAQVSNFLDQRFDLFINLDPVSNLSSEFIAVKTNADMKIGPVPANFNAYDMMIDMGKKPSLTQFIDQFEMILQKTNVHAQPVEV